jgi:hypothetical protein
MSESTAAPGSNQGDDTRVPDLDARELEKLAELVYRLMKEDLVLQKERSGSLPGVDWR